MEGFESIGEHIINDLEKHTSHTATLHRIQEFIAHHFVWFSIPFSTLLAWVFHTMEAIGENTETLLKVVQMMCQLLI